MSSDVSEPLAEQHPASSLTDQFLTLVQLLPHWPGAEGPNQN